MQESTPTRSRARVVMLVMAALAAFYVLYFAGLGGYPLLDPDEPIYGQFIKEMVRGGDWVTPHCFFMENPYDKPPLFYWLSAIGVKAFGLSEFTLRLPSAVCAALIVLMTFLLAMRDFGKRAGVLSAVVMATTLMQVMLSHNAGTDAVMLFFMIASLYSYRRWLDSDGKWRLIWMIACGAAAGFGMVAKGPMVPLLLFVTFIAHLLWTKQLRRLRFVELLIASVFCLGIGLPWFVEMYVLHGNAFIEGFIVKNNITRFVKPLHKSQTGQWYSYFRNIPLLLFFFFPWSVFLIQAIRQNWKANVGAQLATCWVLVGMVFFSISKTQNFTYTYPLFPACAVLVGAFFCNVGKSKEISTPLWFGFGISTLVGVALFFVVRDKYPQASNICIPVALAFVSIFAMPVVSRLLRLSQDVVPWLIAGGMAILSLVLVNFAMPRVSDYTASEAVARQLSCAPGTRIVTYKLWRPGVFYYLQGKPTDVNKVEKPEDIKRFAQGQQPTLFVCNSRDAADLKADCPKILYSGGNLVVCANKAYSDK